MPSKTSCFNKTVFKKNLTRFAPVWGLYLLGLLLCMMMLYADEFAGDGGAQGYWFAEHMAEQIQMMAFVNLIYAPVVAALLFGDLYNSRMCNALHAMPLRRESWFLTNVVSGLVFSLLPTAVTALLSVPLLMGTCVVNAWQIGLLWFAGVNLEYLCFFGIAVFSAFCVGNRFAMAIVYAALNCGAYVVYWLIDTLYTPMLYGVVTPSDWATLLTPVMSVVEEPFIELDDYASLWNLFQSQKIPMSANFRVVPQVWWGQLAWAAVGIGLLVIALLLYRKRRLECAGDAMAIRALEPVLMVGASIAAAAAAYMALAIFLGNSSSGLLAYLTLACGLAVGWFAARMLIARSTRVFRPRNWVGLLSLAAVLAVSLVLTHFDVLGIEDRTPEAENVESVSISLYQNSTYAVKLTEAEDIEALLRLQQLALENRAEDSGSFPVVGGKTLTRQELLEARTAEKSLDGYPCRSISPIFLTFQLKNGRTMQRLYFIWTDQEEGTIANQYLSRWEAVARSGNGTGSFDWSAVTKLYIEPNPRIEAPSREMIDSLLAAVKADCAAETMTQDGFFHNGHFLVARENGDTGTTDSLWVHFDTENDGFGLYVYADSENTLNWLRQHDLLQYEVRPETVWPG